MEIKIRKLYIKAGIKNGKISKQNNRERKKDINPPMAETIKRGTEQTPV